MRYPTSDDIISIYTRVISFLTNQLTVFSRPVKTGLVVFRRLYGLFEVFALVFSQVEVGAKQFCRDHR